MRFPVKPIVAATAMVISMSALATPIDFTDILDRKVHFDNQPKTFVVANYITNFMMIGGAQCLDQIVGMTKDGWEDMRYGEYTVFTKAFPKMLQIPSIGGYHDDILNAERILALRPEAIIIGRSQFAENNARLEIFEKAGIRVVVVDYHAMKIENHCKSTEILGKMLGREKVAAEQISTYRNSLDHVYKTVAALPDSQKRRRVYLEVGSKGLARYGNANNKNVLWGAILYQLGAHNISENSSQPWAPLDREFVISSNPQTIFMAGSIWRGKTESDQMRMGLTVPESLAQERLLGFSKRDGWQQLDAVKSGEIYAVDHGSLRNMADYTFTQFLAKTLYPSAFADINPQKNIADFYKRYLPELQADGTFMIKLKK